MDDDLTASASILVDAPASVIFDILADPHQHPRIDGSGTVQEIVDSPDRLSEGAQFSVQMKRGLGYRTTNTVVEYEDDALIAWRHRGQHRWRYELTPEGEKVRVTETWDGSRYSGLPRLVFKLSGLKGAQRSIEETLVRLKAVAEADAARV
ncbi:SRPBCC family protein [Nocardioides daphniae]|uniref:Dimethyladenosine transferase n=1 Tax=Nocardioides daphniae TaxID=402297 RepID=A0A4V1CW58_9ACTN|nr:SRPBCC family protein [Nocardioides daphniae]QCC76117.1 dimethyladenosine transferase [Nocardioides daphniae]GGD09967.1 hypothetical protein GCM10007231_06000 [Nocardioides daphniae]